MIARIIESRTCRKTGFAIIALTIALLAQSPARVSAQSILGTITGLITDPSGAVVPNAHVTLRETQTGITRTTTANEAGHYTFPSIPAGTYLVTIEQAGFKTVTSSPILLTSAATQVFSATLEVGNTATRVEVKALPPTINTTSGQMNTTLTRNDLVDLPLNTRSVTAYRTVASMNYDYGSLAGMRENLGYYSVDGINAMQSAFGAWSGPTMAEFPVEAISEFKIDENNASSQYQENLNVEIVTRSGTNTFHGSAYYDDNNNALDARSWLGHTIGKGPQEQDAGGSFGGPVIIPHLYNGRDKTFFFTDYERNMFPAGGGGGIYATVPTANMRNGNFSEICPEGFTSGICNNLAHQVYSPYTGQPYANNTITDALSSVSQGIQSMYPVPNRAPISGVFTDNYYAHVGVATHNYEVLERVDHQIDPKDMLTVNFLRVHNLENSYGNLANLFTYQFRNITTAGLTETHTFGPTLVNEFRVAFHRDYSPLYGKDNGSALVKQWGIQGLNFPTNANITGLPEIDIGNFTTISEPTNYFWAENTLDFLDHVTLMKGKHQLMMGAEEIRNDNNLSDGRSLDFGKYSFSNWATTSLAGNGGTGGFAYADFLLGLPLHTERYTRYPNTYNRFNQIGIYFQDRYAITPKLTLNYGLRWDKVTMPVDKNNMRYTYDPATKKIVMPNEQAIKLVNPLFAPGPSSGVFVTAATAGYPSNLGSTPNLDFAPNFGFAYRPFKHSNTVVRGSYSIGYSMAYYPLQAYYQQGPFNSDEYFTNQITNGAPSFAFPDPFGSPQYASVGSEAINSMPKHYRMPYTQEWNLTVEHEFPNQLVAHATYFGNRTLQMMYPHDLNTPPSGNNPDIEWNPYYDANFYSITQLTPGGVQNGNMLDVGVKRQFASGLMFRAGYTWDRSLTDIQFGDVVDYSWWMEDLYNIRRDYGPGGDPVVASRFTVSGIYELPFGTGKRFGANLPGWFRQAFGNWQTSWIFTAQSGQYDTPKICCYDTSNERVYWERPDAISNWKVSNPTRTEWFNPAAFAPPAVTYNAGGSCIAGCRFGTASNGLIIGPGLWNLDFALYKYFQLNEKVRFKFGMQSTNIFNHPNPGDPDTEIEDYTVGWITGTTSYGNYAGRARRIQLNARIEF